MQQKEDLSYGVIPYLYKGDEIYFFLIHQLSGWRGDLYWTFPKGHPEENELPEETAIRELIEETQIILETLNTAILFDSTYTFVHDDIEVNKTASFFLGKAASRAYTLDTTEVIEAGWFTVEEAQKRITYENTKKILNDAAEYLGMLK